MEVSQLTERVRRGGRQRILKRPHHLGKRLDLAHLHKSFGFKTGLTFFLWRKIQERDLCIFVPVRMDNFSQSVNARIRNFHDRDRGFAFLLKSADLGAQTSESVKDGSFSSACKTN